MAHRRRENKFQTPAGKEAWETLGDSGSMPKGGALWRCHADRLNEDLLSRWLPDTAAVALKTDLFDEANGPGQHTLLQSRVSSTIGIDIAQSIALAASASHTGLIAGVCDIRSLPFKEQRFDVVVSLSTLDHFPRRTDIDTALAEIHRVLKPGGLLILTLDNPVNPKIALRAVLPHRILRRLGLVPYYCGATLGPRALRAALSRARLEQLEQTAIMHCPRVLAVAVSELIVRRRASRISAPFLRFCHGFEVLGNTPLRFLSGHFVASLSRRPLESR